MHGVSSGSVFGLFFLIDLSNTCFSPIREVNQAVLLAPSFQTFVTCAGILHQASAFGCFQGSEANSGMGPNMRPMECSSSYAYLIS